MARLIREKDWAATPLGPLQAWPQPLRSSLSISLRSSTASGVFWGPDHLFLYNDAWAAYLGNRHPWALGRPVREVMEDIWPALEDQFRRVRERAETVNASDALLVRHLHGRTFESFWTYSLLPIGLDDGSIGGLSRGDDLHAVLLGRHGRVVAGRSVGDALQQRLTIEQNVDLRGAGGGMDDAQGGDRFCRVLLGPHRASADWEEPGHEGEAQQGDPTDP